VSNVSDKAGSTRLGWIVALVLALLFLALAWATLGHYGITWDEPENFLTGDLYWRFFLTGDRTLLDFEMLKNQWAVADEKPFFYVYTIARGERYPPVANLVSAIAGWLFHEQLGWLGPIEAHHVAIPIFGALGVLVTALFTCQGRRSLAPALVAGCSLALFPLYWGHAHNNVKDVPMAALFAATMWAGWRAFGRERGVDWRWTVAAGILWGLALGVKANALVIPPILFVWLLWLWAWPGFRSWREGRSWKGLLLPAALMLAIGGLVLAAVWPYLWADPIRRLYGVLRYFTDVGGDFRVYFEGQTYIAGETLPWRYALTHLIFTTPLITLALAGLGSVRAAREAWRGESSASALWLIWFGATLIRVSLPGMVVYNGLRQIMELLPALCLLAGLGGQWLWEWLERALDGLGWGRAKVWAGVLLLGLLIVPQIITLARLHPYEGAFFNALAGGERGASERYTLEYWGQSYKDGGEWLNEHAGADAWVAVPIAGHIARYSLRPDLRLIQTDQVAELKDLDGEGYVMVMHNRDWYGGPETLPEYCEVNCVPVYTVQADGAVLLSIYRWPESLIR